MKTITTILFAAICLVSCTKRVTCTNPEFHLLVSGFDSAESKRVLITSYEKGSNFQKRVQIDSTSHPRIITPDYDWAIDVADAKRSFHISNIVLHADNIKGKDFNCSRGGNYTLDSVEHTFGTIQSSDPTQIVYIYLNK